MKTIWTFSFWLTAVTCSLFAVEVDHAA